MSHQYTIFEIVMHQELRNSVHDTNSSQVNHPDIQWH